MKEEEGGHIDQLFREGLGSEDHQIPFRESAWEALEHRLKLHEKRRRIVYWLRPLSGVAALLLLAFAGWWLWPEKEQTLPRQVTVVQEAEKPEAGQVEEPAQAETTTAIADVQKAETSGGQQTRPVIAVSPVEQKELPIAKTTGGSGRGAMSPLASRGDWSPFAANTAAASASKLDPVASFKPVIPPSKTVKKPIPLKLEDEPERNTMAITVLAAPAYNGVDKLNQAKIGGDFGVLFSVAVSKRWAVSTGAIYALKLYETDGDSYHPAQDDGYSYDPMSVNADCRVLDIPLNIDYKLLILPKTSFSLGTGVSTYFMLSEKYSYQYAYGPEQKDAVSLKNNSIHWVSVLNLQASLERQLSSQISISLRPYLKVPFQDIGYGRVRLQSFGIALGTSFNF
ncbi:porin family protein [Mangrovibacterium lignilyticum]|uniref:outer membrane beta-barrel protein n=1 Tax=Mangrovibacterium lignilyticum TaxID=2668052 RepID=UPI0013D1B4A3|nr:outer membrane beta-barrel protein [Mangrovibacterium lignilyticum]